MKFISGVLLSLLINTSTAVGHEFWISPEAYQVASGNNIVAALRGGQKFSGGGFGFLPQRFIQFDLVQGDQIIPVEGRIGDRPALNNATPNDGLWVIVHETTDSKITWNEWEKFVGFVEHKRLENALAKHSARGLPESGFSEKYRRFAKSLIAVGNGVGADYPVGLRTEFVALSNPYIDDMAAGFSVQVLFEGAPRIDAQIEVFEKNQTGEVSVFTVQTDVKGQANIPVSAGNEYLLDAVVLLPVERAATGDGPVWESLWAALTFSVPG
ncbi:MAG: DUF4198 domain-containing protein [Paracoccaceae bacterium]